MEEALVNISSLINSPELQGQLLAVRIILGGVGIFFFIMILVLIVRATWIQFIIYDVTEFLQFRRFGLRTTGKKWRTILARLETGNPAEYRLAVMEADTIFTDVLRRMNVPGQTLQEQLGNVAPNLISNIEDIKLAHETRDAVVHDPDYNLTLEIAQRTLETYETALRQLDLIQ